MTSHHDPESGRTAAALDTPEARTQALLQLRVPSPWEAAVALVMAHPGHTCAELAQLGCEQCDPYGKLRYRLLRHLPEARRATLICTGASRPCSVTGDDARTWYPTRPQAGHGDVAAGDILP